MRSIANLQHFATVAAVAGFAFASSAATVLPEDAPIYHYGLAASDLHDFHGGIYGSFATRNVKDGAFTTEIDANRVNAYLGYDLTRFCTVYVLGGVLSVDGSDIDADDWSSAWGAGLWARLMDDDSVDFLPTISRYRLNCGVEYAYSDAADLAWSEVNGFLTFEIMNENLLNTDFFPGTVSLFFGPVFTYIDLDGYEQVSDNNWGFTIGGSFGFGSNTFVNGGFDLFNDDHCGYFTAGVRF